MNGICKYVAVGCLFVFTATVCFAQMYTITDVIIPGSASKAFAVNKGG
jgi:hypothetical protein